jgi:hypothetical protein
MSGVVASDIGLERIAEMWCCAKAEEKKYKSKEYKREKVKTA